jgi:hypothetical protein
VIAALFITCWQLLDQKIGAPEEDDLVPQSSDTGKIEHESNSGHSD